jgi:hypothetical protein
MVLTITWDSTKEAERQTGIKRLIKNKDSYSRLLFDRDSSATQNEVPTIGWSFINKGKEATKHFAMGL